MFSIHGAMPTYWNCVGAYATNPSWAYNVCYKIQDMYNSCANNYAVHLFIIFANILHTFNLVYNLGWLVSWVNSTETLYKCQLYVTLTLMLYMQEVGSNKCDPISVCKLWIPYDY